MHMHGSMRCAHMPSGSKGMGCAHEPLGNKGILVRVLPLEAFSWHELSDCVVDVSTQSTLHWKP